MIMADAARRNNSALFAKAAAGFRGLVDVASDPIYYVGVFRGMRSVRNHRYLVDGDCKVKQVHDKVLVGCGLLIEHSRSEWVVVSPESCSGRNSSLQT